MNIAARPQGLAEPGGICVARNVYNQIKGKLDLDLEHLGEKDVKNIAEPVTVYRVVLNDKATGAGHARGGCPPVVARVRRWQAAAAAAAPSRRSARWLVAALEARVPPGVRRAHGAAPAGQAVHRGAAVRQSAPIPSKRTSPTA